jgi:FAD binding domain
VVVGATRPGDIGHAVRFAREHGRPIGVLATGHGASVPAGGAVLVTTGRMSTVTIDPSARIARVAAGARWQQVIDAAAPYGLAPQEELFRAARGDKDNFGIVSALELDLFKVPHLYGGTLYFPRPVRPGRPARLRPVGAHLARGDDGIGRAAAAPAARRPDAAAAR